MTVLSAWKAVAMAKVVYNEEQLAALVAKIARVVLEEVEGARDPERLSALDPLPKPRGRVVSENVRRIRAPEGSVFIAYPQSVLPINYMQILSVY